MSWKNEGQQEVDQSILLTFMGLQPLSKQNMETSRAFTLLLFSFHFVFFPSPQIEMRVLKSVSDGLLIY